MYHFELAPWLYYRNFGPVSRKCVDCIGNSQIFFACYCRERLWLAQTIFIHIDAPLIQLCKTFEFFWSRFAYRLSSFRRRRWWGWSKASACWISDPSNLRIRGMSITKKSVHLMKKWSLDSSTLLSICFLQTLILFHHSSKFSDAPLSVSRYSFRVHFFGNLED